MITMGYVVIRLPYKKRSWKVQMQTFVGGGRKQQDIKESDYQAHGFRPSMTLDEAVARKDELNAQLHLRQHQEKQAVIEARLHTEELEHVAYLNPALVTEFESKVLYEGFYAGDREAVQRNKLESHWRAAKRVLFELKLDVSEWSDRKRTFYSHFADQQVSPAYLQKLIRILNLWGKFVARSRGVYFEPLPYPTRFDKERIADAYLESNGGRTGESDALTPVLLEAAKESTESAAWNWLALSLWFGLRPPEVDGLKVPAQWRLERHQGTQVLFVYQTKLKGVARDQRWKYIPCLRPEQEKLLSVIKPGEFERPSIKVVHARFGEHVNLYGGRKGFELLMDSFGYRLEDISLWLGHKSIERTWRNYKNRTKVRIPV